MCDFNINNNNNTFFHTHGPYKNIQILIFTVKME